MANAIPRLRTERFEMPRVERPNRPQASGAPEERGFAAFIAEGGGFASGYWEGEPGILTLTDYPVDEFCMLLEGEIKITSATDETALVSGGDAFVIPRGFCGTWEVMKRARKLFACAGEPHLIAAITGSIAAKPAS